MESAHDQTTPNQSQSKPSIEKNQLSYILIENPSKSNNLGPILRCATAFAVHQVVFVGYEKCSVKGSHGSSKYVNIKAFVNFEQAVKYLKEECGIVSIVGILGDVSLGSSMDTDDDSDEYSAASVGEDVENNVVKVTGDCQVNDGTDSIARYPMSNPVHKRPFPSEGNVCFSISRRPSGIPIRQAQYCDAFIHVQTAAPSILPSIADSKMGGNGTKFHSQNLIYGLLDSQTCLSITLHHFNAFAKYDERIFEGQKFHVAKKQVKGKMLFDEDAEEVRRRRLERKEQLRREAMEMTAFDNTSTDENEG